MHKTRERQGGNNENASSEGPKERDSQGNVNLCLAARTWMTGTPRSFRRWRHSLVWDDAALSTKESRFT